MSSNGERGNAQREGAPRPRVAVVHDWLDGWRGGENVLAEILTLYPDAELFALVDFLPERYRSRLLGKRARTTFLQHLPAARRAFRLVAPLFPAAIESLDVHAFDLVISSSHAVAKGVRTAPPQVHVCYCHTPMRYAWDLREQYLSVSGLGAGLRGALARMALDRLRHWDRRSSNRVTHFVANSVFIRDRIARAYGRTAEVIYPPVDTAFFTPGTTPTAAAARSYFVAASRWVPYKRMDLVAGAFRELPDLRLVLIGDGPERNRVRAAAGPNVEFVGEVPRETLRELLRGARAFVFAAEEDFGILPVEAQACGTPVIAYGRGGARETVLAPPTPRPTGVFFAEQSSADIAAAVRTFEHTAASFSSADCRANAERFGVARFRQSFAAAVERALAQAGSSATAAIVPDAPA